MKRIIISILCFNLFFFSCKSDVKEKEDIKETSRKIPKHVLEIIPISHGTLLLEYAKTTIYIDPVGGITAFEGQQSPDIILITDIHGDHLNIETLEAIHKPHTKIIAPKAVVDLLPEALKTKISIVSNFQSITLTVNHTKIGVEAIPMYNLREEALQYHPKDRGNGYVLTIADKRIYISGDTEDIPEMRALKNIDIAFICMNLPWTMPVENAADAVLEFKPKKVYPYHYRGTEGLSDINLFKTLVNNENSNIEVIQLDWYKAP